MKKAFLLLILSLMPWLTSSSLIAQEVVAKNTIAVLHIDSQGFDLDAEQMGDLVRIELDKLGRFEVMDPYDMEYIIDKNQLTIDNCFGKLCLTELGNTLKVDKMLSGSVSVFAERITVTIRLIDVTSSTVEKTQVMDFLNLKNQIQNMLGITIKKMFAEPVDDKILTKLSKAFDYESSINTPEATRLNLSGPRMGFVVLTGDYADVIKNPISAGGLDASPLMFQFGYQFELKYLNQGDFQALVEFIPVISGLDQGKFLPSIALLNGLRSNRSGWELAFGPVLYLVKKSTGYFDAENNWQLEETWSQQNPGEANPYDIVNRVDNRGKFNIDSGFLFGIGKTFKSGRLNIPLNAFIVPNKRGYRFGLSLGFNARNYRQR